MADPEKDIATDAVDLWRCCGTCFSQLFGSMWLFCIQAFTYVYKNVWLFCIQASTYVYENEWLLRQLFAQFVLLGCLSLLAGAAAMLLLGWMTHRRMRRGQSLKSWKDWNSWKDWITDEKWKDCITEKTCLLAGATLAACLLLLRETPALPGDWLGTLALLALTAPALLTWLDPPDEHVEERRHSLQKEEEKRRQASVGQIGKFSAYSHFYGYLRLMQGEHSMRERLQKFKRDNPAGLPVDPARLTGNLNGPADHDPAGLEVNLNGQGDHDPARLEWNLNEFHSHAVAVLVPSDGVYPTNLTDLKGIGEKVAEVPGFQLTVGGNKRTYPPFPVHEVTSSDGKGKKYVALDKVGALQTLKKLHHHGPAGFTDADCRKRMAEMINELENIINRYPFLRGEMKVVRYQSQDQHVGDIVLAQLTD